jgi:hypothetical protein
VPIWIGWVLSLLVAAFMTLDGVMKLVKPPFVVEGTAKLGYPEGVIVGLGVVVLCCVALYVYPRTAVLGAILLTGYFGGAVASHVRLGEPYFMALIFGIVTWLALLLREPRLRGLLPMVSK